MHDLMPKGFVCWRVDGLELIQSNVGELTRDDNSILAATHEPVHVRARIEGGEFLKFNEHFMRGSGEYTEQELLKAINDVIKDPESMKKNLLIAVKGSTGSGKSHLVRWLYQNVVKTDNTRVVWVVRREDQKMQVIKKFVEDLAKLGSSKAGELEKKIAGRLVEVERFPDELVQELYDNISRLLRFDKTLIKENRNKDICGLIIGEADGKNRLSNLIDSHKDEDLKGAIKDGLKPILRKIVDESILTKSDKSSGFTRENTQKLLKAYQKDRKKENDQLLTTALNHVDIVTELLNQALDIGMNELMKLEGSGFKDIFAELREEMSKHNQQLVIFMEDFSGVSVGEKGLSKLQRDLLAIFTEVASEERAPLRVVMAITNNTFDALEENYLRRHNLTVDIDHSFENTDPMPFLARYLNLSRTDRPAVQKAFDERSPEERLGNNWVPNACATCRYMAECHTTFGATKDGVGFYPLNQEVGRRITQKKPTNPGATVHRLQNLLQKARHEITQGEFPSHKMTSEFLVLNNGDDIGIASLNFVRSAENEIESKKLARYIYLWKKNEMPTDVEKNVFSLFDLGKITDFAAIPPEISREKNDSKVLSTPSEIDAVNLWEVADSDGIAASKLGSNNHQRIRNTIFSMIKENFEQLAQPLKIYEDAFGLHFRESSIRVAGFEDRAVRSGLLNPIFSIPRTRFGAMVLRGAIIEQFRRESKPVGLSGDKANESVTNLANFISEKVNELILVIRKIENSEYGPIGAISKVIKLSKVLSLNASEPIVSKTITKWLENKEQNSFSVELTDEIDRLLFNDSVELCHVARFLTHVSNNKDGTTRFRKVDQIFRLIEKLPDSPDELLKSIFEPDEASMRLNRAESAVNASPKWRSMLDKRKSQILECIQLDAVEKWHRRFCSDFETVEKLIGNDFEFSVDELNGLIQQMFSNSNPTVSAKDLREAATNIVEFAAGWEGKQRLFRSHVMEEPNAKTFLSNRKLAENLQSIANDLNSVFNQIVESTKQIGRINQGLNQVSAEEPINLDCVTRLESLGSHNVDK